MNKAQIKHSFLLLITATIWGIAFVAQSIGLNYVGPFTFNAVRNFIGAAALVPVIAFFSRKKEASEVDIKKDPLLLLKGGILCGILMFFATSFQQFGLLYTTAGKAGFITAFYIVIVPVMGLFLKKRTGRHVWLAVAVAVVGLYFLCMNESFTVNKGDALLFVGSFLFAGHILVIDHFSPQVDGVKLSAIQFLCCGLLSGAAMLLFEDFSWENIFQARIPILYAGILSSGVGYTLQIIGQKGLNPTIASLIMSLESCISVLAGWIILGERMNSREILGCIIVFIAIILAQLPGKTQGLSSTVKEQPEVPI